MKQLKLLILFFILVMNPFFILGQISTNQTKSKQIKNVGAFAQINGINMYYEISGKGAPLLMIHGNGGSSASFKNQVDLFDDYFKVIVADSRGQGQTNNTSDSMTYELMAEDYKYLLDQLKIDSAYVLGWSDGGIIGLLLGRDYPQKVKMLAIMGANLQPDSTAVPSSVIRWLEQEISKTKLDTTEAGLANLQLLQLLYFQPDIEVASLQEIQIPVLVMSGDRDIIKLKHTIKIFTSIAFAQLCIFPGSTHFIVEENPRLFNEAVLRFFKEPFSMPNSMDYFK